MNDPVQLMRRVRANAKPHMYRTRNGQWRCDFKQHASSAATFHAAYRLVMWMDYVYTSAMQRRRKANAGWGEGVQGFDIEAIGRKAMKTANGNDWVLR